MMYQELVRDFAIRTRKNLLALEEARAQGAEVYEITQLVNSTLGLLVFPQQEYVDKIPKTPLHQLAAEGWPVPKVTGGFPQVPDLNRMIRYLRNAIAHFNIKFIGDGTDHIRVLRVWNTDLRTHAVTWQAELSVEDLRKLANRFVEMVLRDFRGDT
jgi:HEPN pEK499 p136